MQSDNKNILICNGELELVRVQKDLYDDVVEFYQNNFMKDEPINQVLGLGSTDEGRQVAGARVRDCLKDEVSFVARLCTTKELVAIRVNKMMTDADVPEENCPFESPALIAEFEYMRRIYDSFDLFKEWNIDCAMDLSYLSTRSDFCKRGLATILTKHSIEFARQMLNGTLAERETLPEHVRDLKPKAVCSAYSSKFTQNLGEKLGMTTLAKIPYTELFYNGKSFAEKMDPIHECATFVAMRL